MCLEKSYQIRHVHKNLVQKIYGSKNLQTEVFTYVRTTYVRTYKRSDVETYAQTQKYTMTIYYEYTGRTYDIVVTIVTRNSITPYGEIRVFPTFTYNLRIRIFLEKREKNSYSRPSLMYSGQVFRQAYGSKLDKKKEFPQ